MAKTAEDTPLIKQFFSVKAQHPEAVLLYRVGDFYESYADDAVLTTFTMAFKRRLGITPGAWLNDMKARRKKSVSSQ